MNPPLRSANPTKWPFSRSTSGVSLRGWTAGALLLAGLSILLALILEGDSAPQLPEYSIGGIARADIVVPNDLVFKDEPSSEKARVSAQEKVLPVYRYSPEKNVERAMAPSGAFQQCRTLLQSSQEIKRRNTRLNRLPAPLHAALLEKLTAVMAITSEALDYLLSEGFDERLDELLASVLNRSATLLIVEDEKAFVAGMTQLRTVEASGKESTRSFDDVLTWKHALQRLENLMNSSSDSAGRSRFITEYLLTPLLQPNLSFDLQATESRQAEAAASVDPVLRQLKKGKVILRQGDEIQPDHLVQIDAMRRANEKASSLHRISGLGSLLAAVLGMCSYFLRLLPRQQWSHPKLAVLLGAVLVANIALIKVGWFFCGAISSKFLVSGFQTRIGSDFALRSDSRVKRRVTRLACWCLGSVLAFLSGPITAGLLVFALPLCERLFSVTTEIRLSELGNVNLPLLRQLILKAAGTYNHSIAVGTLSEGAAKAIGLDPLFARVACLYHDVGKSLQPEYFVENQQGANPHDALSPEESVRIVTSHVSEGIRLAREAALPSAIVDIIPQHHGTKLLTTFYAKARALADGDESKVSKERFRYNGPKPQTKEAAIIMLADGVEAAARTLKDRWKERLLELIRRIVASASEDGQFSDCEITLADPGTHHFQLS